MSDVTEQNRRYWEALAPGRNGQPAAWFLAGGQALDEVERAVIGDVTARRVLQLALLGR